MLKTEKNKVIFICSLIIVLAICFLAFMCIYSHYKERRVFTVERWNTNIWEREYMFDDFLTKYELIGMSKNEVIELLGNEGMVGEAGADFTYYFGKAWSGPVLLTLYFDDMDFVTRYGIIVD